MPYFLTSKPHTQHVLFLKASHLFLYFIIPKTLTFVNMKKVCASEKEALHPSIDDINFLYISNTMCVKSTHLWSSGYQHIYCTSALRDDMLRYVREAKHEPTFIDLPTE